MSRLIIGTLFISSVCCSVALAQVHPLDYFAAADAAQVARPIQTTALSEELRNLPEVHELLDRLQSTEAELDRYRRNLDQIGVEDYGDHFHFTNDELDTMIYQPEGGMGGGPGGPGGGADLATQANNPVGNLWMLWFQNDMKLLEGPGDGKRIFNTTVFQPIMPIKLTDEWKVINRPVITFNSFEVPNTFTFVPNFSFGGPAAGINDPFETEFGLGDIAFIQWLSNSPEDSKMTFGFGWNWMFPTATDPNLGTGKTSLGPSIVAIYLGDRVITGGVIQQYFSIGGSSTRPRVSLMDIQYIWRYRLNPMFSVGFTPNIQWDQVTGVWTVPVGFGFDAMTFAFGKLPMRWGAELQYFASHTGRDFDPEWNFRMYVSPIIPSPDWAGQPLLGKHGRLFGKSCKGCSECCGK